MLPKKKQKERKEQLLHIMTIYDVLRLSFCFHLKFDTLSFQITFETDIVVNVILENAFNDAQTRWNSSQKRTHRNNFKKYTVRYLA